MEAGRTTGQWTGMMVPIAGVQVKQALGTMLLLMMHAHSVPILVLISAKAHVNNDAVEHYDHFLLSLCYVSN